MRLQTPLTVRQSCFCIPGAWLKSGLKACELAAVMGSGICCRDEYLPCIRKLLGKAFDTVPAAGIMACLAAGIMAYLVNSCIIVPDTKHSCQCKLSAAYVAIQQPRQASSMRGKSLQCDLTVQQVLECAACRLAVHRSLQSRLASQTGFPVWNMACRMPGGDCEP